MNKYDWSTEDIFTTDADWEKTFKEVEKQLDFSQFSGKLGTKQGFLACMRAQESVGRQIEKLASYAIMKYDENTKNAFYDGMKSRVYSIYSKFGESTAFITPELTSLDSAVIEGYIADSELKDYDYNLKCVLKEKAHVLSESEEKLLAKSSETLSSFRDIFGKIDNADLPLGKVNCKGKSYNLTHGTYGVLLRDKDVAVRKAVFKKYCKAYVSLINTITATYYGNVKKDVFEASARKYASSLSCALSTEDVPEIVYKNLIETVNDALPSMHRYMAEKKKLLGVNKMHMYDVYVPVVDDAEMELEYDDAYKLVIEGLSVLGKDYAALLQKAYDERWLDVYEKDGKRSGAYSNTVYDTHPYVLLNYQKTTHDVFTIAHEMGHSIHSYFANAAQPYAKANYTIFVAEVASTVNEVLLLKHLLKKATDKKLKKYLLSYMLEMIRTTLFRQTQFAEFEEAAHSLVENGSPLTKENLCDLYLKLNKKYYGKAVVSDDEVKYEWARIPHFYNCFYVYKYATGIISALAITERILNEGEPAVADYFKFLSSGGSDGPVELLKIAGVDLTQKQPFVSAFKAFEDILDEFAKL